MTLPRLTSPTAELIAYRDEMRTVRNLLVKDRDQLQARIDHMTDMLLDVLNELERREPCTHEDFTENLEGRTCRTCGLETK